MNGASQQKLNQGTYAGNIKIYLVYHANLILKRLIAMVKKNVIIAASINVSFQTPLIPSPFIITDFTMV